MILDDHLAPIRILISQSPMTEAIAKAALVLAYQNLYNVSLLVLKMRCRAELAGAIAGYLEDRKIGFDRKRVDSLDWEYVRGFRINFHRLIPEVLGGLNETLERSFNKCRRVRNMVSYEVERQLDPRNCVRMAQGMMDLAGLIRSL